MKNWAGIILVVLAGLLAACLLLWEAGDPIYAVQSMIVLDRVEPRVCAIVAPFAIGAVMTSVGMILGVVSLARGRPVATLAWLILADAVAPAVALAGSALVVATIGAPAV